MGFSNKIQFTLCIGFLLVLISLTAVFSFGPWQPIWRFVAVIGLAHIPYAGAIWLIGRNGSPGPTWTLFASAVLLRIVLIPAPTALSDDIHRFIWDGEISGQGINPYTHPPDAPKLEPFRNANWQEINNKELRTIYPPAAQALFASAALVSSEPAWFKFLAVGADTGLLLMIFLLCGGTLRSPANSPEQRSAIQRAMLYGLNPLVCVETGLSGHLLEPATLLACLAAVYYLGRTESAPRKNGILAALGFATACGLKFAPALLFPSMARKNRWFIFFGVFFTAAVFSVSISTGTRSVETLDTFARRWESNSGIFSLVKNSARLVTGAVTGTSSSDDIIHIPAMDGLVSRLDGTFLSMHKDGDYPPDRPASFTLGDISLNLAKVICALGLLLVLAWTIKHRYEPLQAGLWIFAALLLLSPVLHPWYILWVLPFAAVKNMRCWFAFTAFLPLSYLALDDWWQHGHWYISPWIRMVEYASLPIAFFAFRYFNAFYKENR